jgi:predicted dienelactone hydrolase
LRYTKTYAQDNVPISQDRAVFPVIIASHGAGPMIQQYSWLCEELASHGYIVIGINHPYVAAVTRFPDGRIIKSLIAAKKKEGKKAAKLWKQEQLEIAAKDVKFVLDTLAKLNMQPSWLLYNKLDLENIGICGHSAGGSLAMRMSLNDRRIKAGVALDSSMRGNPALKSFSTPFLVLMGGNSRYGPLGQERQDFENLTKLCHLPGMCMTIVMLKQVGHMAFSDMPLLLHSTLLTQLLSNFISVDIDASSAQASKMIKISKTHIVNFFDAYLKSNSHSAPK